MLIDLPAMCDASQVSSLYGIDINMILHAVSIFFHILKTGCETVSKENASLKLIRHRICINFYYRDIKY